MLPIAFDDLRDGASIVVFWYDSNASPVEFNKPCVTPDIMGQVNDKRFLPMYGAYRWSSVVFDRLGQNHQMSSRDYTSAYQAIVVAVCGPELHGSVEATDRYWICWVKLPNSNSLPLREWILDIAW